MSSKRIFLGVQEIAGMMERLNNAFHDMGIKSDFYCMYDYSFVAKRDNIKEPDILIRYRKHTNMIRQAKNRNLKRFWYLFQMIDIIGILFYSIIHYDKYIYVFGHGMFIYNCYLKHFQELEFWILRLFHKDIIVWCCGSDSRAPYCDCDIYNGNMEQMMLDTKVKSKKIQMLEKYATIIDYSASSHFHTKPYIIYNCVGVPIDEKEMVYRRKEKNRKLTVMHAPSNKEYKGTFIIRKVIEELKEIVDFEYIEISGMTHDQVLERLCEADIVIDQLFSDTPLAGFATEASINGIPVIVGGYYAQEFVKVRPEPIEPTIYCTPDELKEKLLYLLQYPSECERIGREEQEYVKKNNMSKIVAKKFLNIFDGKIPNEWLFEPQKNEYIWGAGIPKEKVIRNIKYLIEQYGEESLCICDNDNLLKKYIEVYKGE